MKHEELINDIEASIAEFEIDEFARLFAIVQSASTSLEHECAEAQKWPD